MKRTKGDASLATSRAFEKIDKKNLPSTFVRQCRLEEHPYKAGDEESSLNLRSFWKHTHPTRATS